MNQQRCNNGCNPLQFPCRIFDYSACKNCNQKDSCYYCEVPYKIVYEPPKDVHMPYYGLGYP
jgi:hypothetical protein